MMRKRKTYSYYDLEIISKNMASLYKSGINIIFIIELLRELPLKREYISSLVRIEEKVRAGVDLGEAFKNEDKLFPIFFTGLLELGEKSGKLADVLEGISDYYRRINSLKREVISALAYPLFLLILMFILIVLFTLFIVPSFEDIYRSMNKNPEGSMEVLIRTKEFILNNPLLVILLIFCWFFAIPYLLYSYNKKESKRPFISRLAVYKALNEYILILMLSIIVKSDVGIHRGLNICILGTPLQGMKPTIKDVRHRVHKGESIYDSCKGCGSFSKVALSFIKLGEESGTLDERLNYVQSYLEENTINRFRKITLLLQPIMIIVVGIVVLLFISTVILPIFNLSGGITG